MGLAIVDKEEEEKKHHKKIRRLRMIYKDSFFIKVKGKKGKDVIHIHTYRTAIRGICVFVVVVLLFFQSSIS